MGVFTNYDIKLTREKLNMTAADLAERVGCEPATIYNYESSKSNPDPDMMFNIATAFGDPNIWHRWMRTKYPSYARMHPENNGYDLTASIALMFPELRDILALQDALLRDAASGRIDNPDLLETAIKEVDEGIAAMQNARNQLIQQRR